MSCCSRRVSPKRRCTLADGSRWLRARCSGTAPHRACRDKRLCRCGWRARPPRRPPRKRRAEVTANARPDTLQKVSFVAARVNQQDQRLGHGQPNLANGFQVLMQLSFGGTEEKLRRVAELRTESFPLPTFSSPWPLVNCCAKKTRSWNGS